MLLHILQNKIAVHICAYFCVVASHELKQRAIFYTFISFIILKQILTVLVSPLQLTGICVIVEEAAEVIR
jgi:hypothetical protein